MVRFDLWNNLSFCFTVQGSYSCRFFCISCNIVSPLNCGWPDVCCCQGSLKTSQTKERKTPWLMTGVYISCLPTFSLSLCLSVYCILCKKYFWKPSTCLGKEKAYFFHSFVNVCLLLFQCEGLGFRGERALQEIQMLLQFWSTWCGSASVVLTASYPAAWKLTSIQIKHKYRFYSSISFLESLICFQQFCVKGCIFFCCCCFLVGFWFLIKYLAFFVLYFQSKSK